MRRRGIPFAFQAPPRNFVVSPLSLNSHKCFFFSLSVLLLRAQVTTSSCLAFFLSPHLILFSPPSDLGSLCVLFYVLPPCSFTSLFDVPLTTPLRPPLLRCLFCFVICHSLSPPFFSVAFFYNGPLFKLSFFSRNIPTYRTAFFPKPPRSP